MVWLAVLATTIGVVPLAHVVGMRGQGQPVDAAYGWLALAFAVSFVADVVGLLGYGLLSSQVYLVSQAALFAAVLIPSRPVLEWAVWVLLFTASLSVVARQGEGLDVLLHVVAFASVSGLAWMLGAGRLRLVLGVGFAALAVAWCGYAYAPSLATWGGYQVTRLAIAVAFCWSVTLNGERDGKSQV